jgi:EmrB/QacA subfamily drug resistance transporter
MEKIMEKDTGAIGKKVLSKKWWTLGIVCFAIFMVLLDGNVVNLAIPKIIASFNASLAQIEWINNAYLLTFAISLITLGRLGDEFGRKKLFIIGLFMFTLGSFLCGFAPNSGWLIGFRVIQGFGGATMMPATLSLIASNFEKKERGMAMGVWGAVAGLAIVLGPILGGYLTDIGLGSAINNLLNIKDLWRYVFYINIPIGIVAIVLAFVFIPESRDSRKSHSVDFAGIILSAISIFSLTYAFIEGSKFGWFLVKNDFILFGKVLSLGRVSIIPILFLIAAITAFIFLVYEKRRTADPLVDIQLFKNFNFSIGNISGAILNFAQMGAFFLLPLFLQVVLGYSAIKTGTVLLPLAAAIMIMAPVAGKLSDKLGAKFIIIAGLIFMSGGLFYLGHFSETTTPVQLILPFIVLGIGMGLALSPLTNITLLQIPSEETGGASGVFSTTRQIGSIMGIAILGLVLQTQLSTNIASNVAKIEGLPPQIQAVVVKMADSGNMMGGNMEEQLKQQIMSLAMSGKLNMGEVSQGNNQGGAQKPATQADMSGQMEKFQEMGREIGVAVKHSFVQSINFTFKISSIITLLGALTSFFFKNNKAAGIEEKKSLKNKIKLKD